MLSNSGDMVELALPYELFETDRSIVRLAEIQPGDCANCDAEIVADRG